MIIRRSTYILQKEGIGSGPTGFGRRGRSRTPTEVTRKVRPQRGAVVEREVPMARSIGLRSHASSRGDILSIGSGRRIPEIRDSPSNGVEGRRLLSAPELLLASGKFLTQKTVRNSYQILCEELKATIPEVSLSRTSAQGCSCINLRQIHHGLILSRHQQENSTCARSMACDSSPWAS
jgi:hypothetical protein